MSKDYKSNLDLVLAPRGLLTSKIVPIATTVVGETKIVLTTRNLRVDTRKDKEQYIDIWMELKNPFKLGQEAVVSATFDNQPPVNGRVAYGNESTFVGTFRYPNRLEYGVSTLGDGRDGIIQWVVSGTRGNNVGFLVTVNGDASVVTIPNPFEYHRNKHEEPRSSSPTTTYSGV